MYKYFLYNFKELGTKFSCQYEDNNVPFWFAKSQFFKNLGFFFKSQFLKSFDLKLK